MRPTLRQVFVFSLLGLLLGLALVFYLILEGSQRAILQSSERYRELASREVAQRVTTYLNEAPMAVSHFEQQVNHGLIDPSQTASLEHGLLSLLLDNDHISEATLTYSKRLGSDADGNILTDQKLTGQVAVLRSTTAEEFVCRETWFDGGGFISQTFILASKSQVLAGDKLSAIPSADPTDHPTFQTTADKNHYDPSSDDPDIKHGQIISTDLHWSQINEMAPNPEQRVEVSVQKVIENARGEFAGVLRVGLMKTQIDGSVRQHITGEGESDPHLIFICDNQGRLITGFGKQDRVEVSNGDLRIGSDNIPAAAAMALKEPILRKIDGENPLTAASFRLGKEVYLSSFRYLPGTQDWIVGIVVPRDFYLGSLLQIRDKILWTSLGLIALIMLAGSWIVRSVVQSHSLILRETARMNEFVFSASQNSSRLRDIDEVLHGLEKAKTAMRAMSKYVPVNLVRQLYHEGEEPTLGGKSCELSVLFTDIKNFTALAENKSPDELARLLGRYLEVMAKTIQSEKGTIDKYIGDSVMTFWNAPEAVADHEILACRAALRCQDSLRDLYDHPDWKNAPRFETRFGLHRCVASVGNFGAPERLNYTAIGDGINLASRLEGLNKFYGTSLIASENIYAAAREKFEFRLLDRVSVLGKTEDLTIYELIAERGSTNVRPQFIDAYENAFALYQKGDFAAALKILEAQSEDPPTQLLAARCRGFIKEFPRNWNGVHNFESK